MWNDVSDYILDTYPGWRFRDAIVTPSYFRQLVNQPAVTDSELSYGFFQRTYSRPWSKWKLERGRRTDWGNSPFYSEVSRLDTPSATQVHLYKTSSYSGYDVVQDILPSGAYATIASDLYEVGDVSSFPSLWANSAASILELRGYGATGIANTLPTVPEASLANTIGELLVLQDIRGVPYVPGEKLLDVSSIGKRRDSAANLGDLADEWLNWQFAVLPTVNDFGDLMKAARGSANRIEQLRRDNNRGIRRRWTPAVEESEEVTTVTGVYPGAQNVYNFAIHFDRGTLETKRVTTRKVWFSGKYSYTLTESAQQWLNDFRDFDRTMQIIPNLDTVWQLTAWSWLVDWVSNASDVMLNASYLGRDGLRLEYGYVMCDTTLTETQTWTGNYRPGTRDALRPFETSQSRVVRTKQRIRASPWGFYLDWEGLDPRQLSILAALGVSRIDWK